MNTNLTEIFFDRAGKAYEGAYAENPGLLEFLQSIELPLNASVLDVGCGTGKPVSSTLASRGYRVHGIDRSQVMVDLCRAQVPGPNASFERQDMLAYAPEKKFDAVFAVFCLYALSRRQTADLLTRCAGWLAARGMLFLATIPAEEYPVDPSCFDADGLYASGVDNVFMGQTVKIALLTRRGWETLLDAAGFEVADSMTRDFVPPEDTGCQRERHWFVKAQRRE